MTDLVIRPLRAGEHTLFQSMPEPPTVGMALLGRDFAETMAARQYRPEWTWVALDGDTVIARAAWWGGPDDSAPVALDWFDPGADPMVGAQLLRAASFTVDYHLMLPPDWRDVPETHLRPSRASPPPAPPDSSRSWSGCGTGGRRPTACQSARRG